MIDEYINAYIRGMTAIDKIEFAKATDAILKAAFFRKNIWVAGNGGSAAISEHLCCDFSKGTKVPGHHKLRPMSLSSNLPLITAIANDISYEDTISYQVENMMEGNDVLILISSSGNSPNIVRAATAAKDIGTIIGLTGFTGGKLMEMADIKLHIPINNYGVVEDCHQSIMHLISQTIAKDRGVNVSF